MSGHLRAIPPFCLAFYSSFDFQLAKADGSTVVYIAMSVLVIGRILLQNFYADDDNMALAVIVFSLLVLGHVAAQDFPQKTDAEVFGDPDQLIEERQGRSSNASIVEGIPGDAILSLSNYYCPQRACNWQRTFLNSKVMFLHGYWAPPTGHRSQLDSPDRATVKWRKANWQALNMTDRALWTHEYSTHSNGLSEKEYFKYAKDAYVDATRIIKIFERLPRTGAINLQPLVTSINLNIKWLCMVVNGQHYLQEIQIDVDPTTRKIRNRRTADFGHCYAGGIFNSAYIFLGDGSR
ncbi:hypothetical protein QR680_004233 [Steinernema hermaphroditum]|uniref:Uncharacterized protein n=1 Tax=Steinernema hermaphroditum TaxID=289476 RepID=A0AA39HQB9_9BILA|nr:hypothetical protein QR680_004233 [Steinernema hermaphroditum]